MAEYVDRFTACAVGTLFLLSALSACPSSSVAQPTDATRKQPYLLMVTSLDPPLGNLSEAQAALLNDTPFDGVAISIMGIYDGGPLPDEPALMARCAELRGICKKTIWPRVYLNRLIGFLPKASRRECCTNPEYFDRIKGLDLWDESGARSDFLTLWRLSLRAAKALGAPGVVADFECYNCGGLANPNTLASATARSLPATLAALRKLGAELTDIVAQEYPDAILWALFTELGRADHYWNTPGTKAPLLALHAYIFEGLLDQARKHSQPLTLVSGGEDDLGYYSPSLKALRDKIAARAKGHRSWLSRYGKRLALAGTITVWNDDTKLTGWARKDAGDNPHFKTFTDFKPLLEELFHTYPYVWFYVPMVTDYNPFDPKTAPDLNARLRETIETSLSRPQEVK